MRLKRRWLRPVSGRPRQPGHATADTDAETFKSTPPCGGWVSVSASLPPGARPTHSLPTRRPTPSHGGLRLPTVLADSARQRIDTATCLRSSRPTDRPTGGGGGGGGPWTTGGLIDDRRTSWSTPSSSRADLSPDTGPDSDGAMDVAGLDTVCRRSSIIYSSLFTVNGSNDTIQLNKEKTTIKECNRHTVLVMLECLKKAVVQAWTRIKLNCVLQLSCVDRTRNNRPYRSRANYAAFNKIAEKFVSYPDGPHFNKNSPKTATLHCNRRIRNVWQCAGLENVQLILDSWTKKRRPAGRLVHEDGYSRSVVVRSCDFSVRRLSPLSHAWCHRRRQPHRVTDRQTDLPLMHVRRQLAHPRRQFTKAIRTASTRLTSW